MSVLLRLYPRAWRARYGDELAAMLEEHPASLLDRLDLIRGALDARLHPQVPGAVATEQEILMHQRQLRVMPRSAASPGSRASSFNVLPATPEGYVTCPGVSTAIGIADRPALGELGTRHGSATSARTGHIGRHQCRAGGPLFMPWPSWSSGFRVPGARVVAVLRGAMNRAIPAGSGRSFVLAALDADRWHLGRPGALARDPGGTGGVVPAWLAFTGRASAADLSPA
jgi:hypothetical protein